MAGSSACTRDTTGDRLEPLDDAVAAAVSYIDSDDYLRKLGVIAHDSMGGRDTPSRGLEMTAAWIASEFDRMGLVPAGDDGSYIQRYPIDTVRSAPNVAGILEAATRSSKKNTSSSVPTWITSASAYPTPKATASTTGPMTTRPGPRPF